MSLTASTLLCQNNENKVTSCITIVNKISGTEAKKASPFVNGCNASCLNHNTFLTYMK